MTEHTVNHLPAAWDCNDANTAKFEVLLLHAETGIKIANVLQEQLEARGLRVTYLSANVQTVRPSTCDQSSKLNNNHGQRTASQLEASQLQLTVKLCACF